MMISYNLFATLSLLHQGINVVNAVLACSSDTGTTYNVGPNQLYTTIGSVPLSTLVAGDHVCIYAGTYNEKFVINRSGTASAPIVFQGVPDASGNLPVIDGNGAVTPLNLDYWGESRQLIKIGAASSPTPADGGIVSHVRVENLRIQNTRSDTGVYFLYTDDNGSAGTYAKNAACLQIEQGYNIEIVGNEMAGCGNGIFITPGNSGDVLIEGNYIHGNGHSGSIFEHNVYTETLGITYKYNRFGPLCPGCLGSNLKDRSAGLEVAYNFIEEGGRQLELVDSSNYNTEPSYAVTHVYGNILIETNASNNGNRQMVHYGGDGADPNVYRTGVCYFYHNTLLSTRTGKNTFVRLSSDATTMDARNNIIYATDVDVELLAEKRGTLLFTNNWIREGYSNWVEATYGGSITEAGTVTDASTGDVFADANFASSPYDLHLLASLDFSTALAAGVPGVTEEYVMHLTSQPRAGTDLGAFGSGVQSTSSPSISPTKAPSTSPTQAPTKAPVGATSSPSKAPSSSPTKSPTKAPVGATSSPSKAPSSSPTKSPTDTPSASPSRSPTEPPSPVQCSNFTSEETCPTATCNWVGKNVKECQDGGNGGGGGGGCREEGGCSGKTCNECCTVGGSGPNKECLP